MGRRRIRKPDFRQNLLTQDLVLKALVKYSKPVPLDAIVKQVLHLEPRLGQDRTIYREPVAWLVEALVQAGRIEHEFQFPGGSVRGGTEYYWLGPLERLALT